MPGKGKEGVDALATRPMHREEIVLGCPGSPRVASFINGRYLRIMCRQKRCKRDDGARVFHIWDTFTGRLVDTETEQANGGVIPPREEQT